ncbi:MAG: GMC family oxidoreductase [Planctomycetes bacterium]|nr:GMC family oxidoreductase [Planctomycetota bacterium]
MKTFDAAIVGLGAAGCHAARALTALGLRAVALDAGPELAPSDLPERVPTTSLWRKVLSRRQPVQARSVSFHPALAHLYVDDRRNPYRTRGGSTFLWIRGRQVGGRLHTWARMALRLSDADFTRALRDGHGTPWPIRHADLAPYYDLVESLHGLSAARDGVPQVPDGHVTVERRLLEPALLFKQRVEARWPERRVIPARVLEQPRDPLPVPLRHALATGRLELLRNAAVARVLLDDGGSRAVGVEYVDATTGCTERVSVGLVVLCASTIETVRILWNSRHARHPHGLGNADDQLGRHVMDHGFVVAAGSTGPDYRALASGWSPRHANPLDLAADLDFYIPDFTASLDAPGFVRGFGVQGKLTPTQWGMALFGEMLPHRDNRVTLARRRDSFGIPIANVCVRRRANDLAMIRAQKHTLHELAACADLRIEMPLPAPLRALLWRAVGPEVGVLHLGLSIHETGGARMGDDPAHSVVDPHNRLWDVPNVLVTDGACFPSTGCQNPTLTIMAVTERACSLAVSAAPTRQTGTAVGRSH